MPKKSKKGYVKSLGDVTLNDFANSSVPTNRTKKVSNNVNVVLKQEVEKSWEEKEEEDFEGEFVSQENEDGTISYVIQKVSKTQKKSLSTDDSKESGNNFPIDIWFIISEYIKPEDVGTFAAICRTSFEVVCSAKFWFNLYRRYYNNVPNLPESLQPESLIRRYGLKKNVIRALYYMYKPFVNKIQHVRIFEEHPESLKNYECHLVWYTKKNKKFIYFFKMKREMFKSLSHSKKQSEVPDLLEILEDVSANPEEYCKVLEVSCFHFNPIQPHLIGLFLKSVSLTLSSVSKCRYHRLQLIFGSRSCTSKSLGGADSTVVILDPVINFKVLDWWHPLYPHNRNEMGVLLSSKD